MEHNKTLKISLKIRFLILAFLVGCAGAAKVQKTVIPSGTKTYRLKDKAGTFDFRRESGNADKEGKLQAVKQIISETTNKKLVMERSVVLAKVGSVKNGVRILRPEKSEYVVWFDGQEYSTKMEIDEKNRSMQVTLVSPDASFSGVSSHAFPEGTGVYCFFSQLLECVSAVGFIDKAVSSKGGSMNFHIVWEGWPFFQQQYTNLREEVFSGATLTFDGESENGILRFSLSVSDQIIFYHVQKDGLLRAIFWPAQGMSIGETGSAQ